MLQKTKSVLLRFQKLMSYATITLGAFFTAVLIPTVMNEPQKNIPVLIISGILIGVLPMIAGVLFLNRTNKKIKKEIDDFNEKVLLSTAKSRNGTITATELVEVLNLNLDESTNLLNSFVLRGIATTDVNSNGIIIYKFPEFLQE